MAALYAGIMVPDYLTIIRSLDRKQFSAVAVGATVAYFLIRKLLSSRRKRRLYAKIAAFHQVERQRRQAIRAKCDGDAQIQAKFNEITSLPFNILLEKLRSGALKAVDVLHAYQRAALLSNEGTNAVTEFIDITRAEAVARKLDLVTANERKPLHGIPVSIKENFFYPGTDATAGFSQYLGCFNNMDIAVLIQFLEWMGCVVFCKTNVPQAMLSFDSRNAIHGITRNPHNLDRSPGGSSSGEGAIVGAKASILGVGSDIGGSLRMPAAWCGCFTLKPTSSRMPVGGSFPSQYNPRVIVRDFHATGFVTQDVDTLVTMHRLLYSIPTFDKFPMASLAPVPFREDLFTSAGRTLTIGYYDTDGNIETVPAMKRAVRLAREALEKHGHRLVPWRPPRIEDTIPLYYQAMSVDGLVAVTKWLEEDVEVARPNVLNLIMMKLPRWVKKAGAFIARPFVGEIPAKIAENTQEGSSPNDANVVLRHVFEYRRLFKEEFSKSGLDALLLPSFACPSVPLDMTRLVLGSIGYPGLFNFLDWPAGVCPVTNVMKEDEAQMVDYPANTDIIHRVIYKASSSDSVGLPVSIQIAAPPFREELILRLMSEVVGTPEF